MAPTLETTRVLFVDDERQVLDSLRRALRSQRGRWEMDFANGGEQALARLAASTFDVLVTDMRMPGVDGTQLLKHSQDHYPSMVRIVLSGHTALEATLRIVRTAHQFLPKPTDTSLLKDTIERAVALHSLVRDNEIRRAIGGVDTLPALPDVYISLTEQLSKVDPDLDAIGSIVERDSAIGSKVLQLVNSAFFGLPKRVASVREAVNYIGLNALKSLVLAIGAFRSLTADQQPPGYSAQQEQWRAIASAYLARKLMEDDGQEAGDAYLAGLLHDIGKLLMVVRMPAPFREAQAASLEESRPLHEVEYERLGFSHAEAGAYLLALWGLPYPVVEAVAHHHRPSRVESRGLDIVTAVHAASALVGECSFPERHPTLDLAHLERLGLAENLGEWRALAARAVANEL